MIANKLHDIYQWQVPLTHFLQAANLISIPEYLFIFPLQSTLPTPPPLGTRAYLHAHVHTCPLTHACFLLLRCSLCF